MTMNMASSSFKSTGGSVSVALVVLLVAVMAAETSAQQRFRITFANELAAPLTMTVPGTLQAHDHSSQERPDECSICCSRAGGELQVSGWQVCLATPLRAAYREEEMWRWVL